MRGTRTVLKTLVLSATLALLIYGSGAVSNSRNLHKGSLTDS
jgi:hypothetical protein